MTTSTALAILTEQEAIAKLEAAGYRREPCKACEGRGHFTIVNDDAHKWQKYVCESCQGAAFIWRGPLLR